MARRIREIREEFARQNHEELMRRPNVSASDMAGALSSEFGKGMDEKYGRLIIERGLWEDVLSLAFHPDRRVAFRASWALEWAYFRNPESFTPYVGRFLANYYNASNPSVHRHYTKMMCHMLRKGILKPEQVELEKIAEKSCDLMISPTTKVAVKVWCMEILYDLSPVIDWVDDNLRQMIEDEAAKAPSPAMLNHSSKVLKRMAAGSRKR